MWVVRFRLTGCRVFGALEEVVPAVFLGFPAFGDRGGLESEVHRDLGPAEPLRTCVQDGGAHDPVGAGTHAERLGKVFGG